MQGILLAIVALAAIPAGLAMIISPDGSEIGISPEVLRNSPFTDFLVPGYFLLIVNGIVNLVATILTFLKHEYSGWFGIILGSVLISWIIIQVIFTGIISFMQPLFFFIGLAEIGIGLLIIRNKKMVKLKSHVF